MDKPPIHPTAQTQPFWQACREGRLLYQVCGDCGGTPPIPGALCARCHGGRLQWRESAGRGVVLSHTTVHRAPTPAFKGDLPYVIALVDLDEGFRLMVNVRDARTPVIGQRVRIDFEPRGPDRLPIAVLETP